MQSLKSILSAAPQWTLLIASAVGITAASIRVFESEETKRKRSELKKQKELRYLTQRISVYARTVHQRYPTGDVIVSERDLAEEFRKRPEVVITALNLLLNEEKVQKAPLNGYWNLTFKENRTTISLRSLSGLLRPLEHRPHRNRIHFNNSMSMTWNGVDPAFLTR